MSIHLTLSSLYKPIISLVLALVASSAFAGLSPNPISFGNATSPIMPCDPGSLKYSPMCLFPDIVSGTLSSKVFTCNAGVNRGTSFVGSEAEPHLAVNPTNPSNMVAYWQQDRWARLGGGGATVLAYTKDGGLTWKLTNPLITTSRCSGATVGSAGEYDHATDPWVIFDKNGTLYAQALSFDGLAPRPSGSLIVSISKDGGETWGQMSPLALDIVTKEGGGAVPLLDKNMMTADPVRVGPNNDPVLYATWAYFQSNNKSDIYLSRSFDGGLTWEGKKKIYTLEQDLPKGFTGTNGSLGSPLIEITKDGATDGNGILILSFTKDAGTRVYSIIRSFDGGNTWERKSIPIATAATRAGLGDSDLIDPELKDASGAVIPVRDAIGGVGDSSLNAARNIIYFTYQDFDTTTKTSKVMITRSTNNGATWSKPIKVNNSNAFAFEPSVDVAANGTVGVLYVDTRRDVLGPKNCTVSTCGPFSADYFVAQFSADLKPKGGSLNGATTRLTDTSIDYRQAPLLFGAGGVIPGGYFLGDYQGFSSANGNFVAAVAVTTNQCSLIIPETPNAVAINECNRDDIYFGTVAVK